MWAYKSQWKQGQEESWIRESTSESTNLWTIGCLSQLPWKLLLLFPLDSAFWLRLWVKLHCAKLPDTALLTPATWVFWSISSCTAAGLCLAQMLLASLEVWMVIGNSLFCCPRPSTLQKPWGRQGMCFPLMSPTPLHFHSSVRCAFCFSRQSVPHPAALGELSPASLPSLLI